MIGQAWRLLDMLIISIMRRSVPILLAAAALPPQAAAAQAVANHAAHHPGNGTPAATVPQPAAPAPPSASPSANTGAAMSKMMDEMMGGEMEGGTQTAAYSALLTLPELDQHARTTVAAEAAARLHQGLTLARQAGDAHGPGQADSSAIASQLREAAALVESGAATTAALDGSRLGSKIANDWFRSEMGLGTPEDHAPMEGKLWGLSAGHWLFMAVTLLGLAALLLLQLLRLRRVRALIAPGQLPRPVESKPSASLDPTGAKTGTAVARQQLSDTDQVPARQAAPPNRAAVTKLNRWSGELRIAQIFDETPTVKSFRMILPGADRLPFDFMPGQFLQVEVPKDDGSKAKRSYTIASSPTQRAYVELTVKREAQGAVSRYMHDALKPGDLLHIAGPFGHFTFTGTDAESIVLIAGGVGITPMMSVLRFLTDTAWSGDIFFVYAARSTEEFVFRSEIEQLERRHSNLHVFASMQRSPGTVWHGAEGHITRELLEGAVPEIAKRRVHLCGPPSMMAAMRDILTQIGVPQAQIYSEAFGPASLPIDDLSKEDVAEQPEASSAEAASEKTKVARDELAATTVTFSIAGISAPLDTDETILEAAETAGVEIPYSCRVGECGVCVTRLLEGEVTMDVETGLDAADKAQGYVLACQARCARGPLVVEA